MSTSSMTHDALIYGADDEYLAALVPFVRAGLAADEAVLVAVPGPQEKLLREELGGTADAVRFLDRDVWYERPVATIAGWRRALADATAHRHRVRVVGEVAFGAESRHASWTRYEAAVNRVFAGSPASIICPYDARVLPSRVLLDARRTHPAVRDPVRRDSDTYLPAEHLLRLIPEPMPEVTGAPAIAIALADAATPARHAVRDLCARLGWSGVDDRMDDLLLAITEIASNGIRHGRAPRHFRAWVRDRTVVCEVSDAGPGPADPLVGYRPPPDGPLVGGRGLWLARQICDELAIDTRGGRTTVRFLVNLDDPSAVR